MDKIVPTSQLQKLEMTKTMAKDKSFATFPEAVMYMSTKMAEIFKEQIVRIRSFGGGRGNRRIAETRGGGRAGGRGNGRGRGRHRGGRHDGRSGGQDGNRGGRGINENKRYFNRVLVVEATRDVTGDEWSRLGADGRRYVNEKRSRNQARRGNADRDVIEARARGSGAAEPASEAG